MKARNIISMMVLSVLHNKRLEVNETSVAGGFSRHVRGNPENYKNQNKGYGFGALNQEAEWIMEFCAAMSMTLGNGKFKKSKSHPVIYEFGPSKMQVDCYLARRDKRKFVKDTKL